MTNPCRRHLPEAVLAHLTWATEPPVDIAVRADFVRLSISRFAWTRGYGRLASLFYSAPLDDVKGLFLALQGSPIGGDEDTCPVTYRRALKSVAPAWYDAEFIRLAAVAGDVLDWSEDQDEWDRYVRPAWLVLCDEVEFERERDADDAEERFAYRHHIARWYGQTRGYSRNEARNTAIMDARRWRE